MKHKKRVSAPAKGRLMTQAEIAEELGLERRNIIRWSKSGANAFPKPVRVVARTYLFRRREIESWEFDRAWAEGREPFGR